VGYKSGRRVYGESRVCFRRSSITKVLMLTVIAVEAALKTLDSGSR
jgi:hypothetical protein